MAIVVHPFSRVDEWMSEFNELLPDEDLRVWPDIGDPSEAEYLIAWIMARTDLATLTNLKAVLCLGAGTEQWQKPGAVDVPVVRLTDPAMADEMATYCLHWVVRLQRHFDEVLESQRAAKWKIPSYVQAANFRVGVLGYGAIGSRVGRAFADFGYGVNAWTRSGGTSSEAQHFVGADQLEDFLRSSDAVINVLPSTDGTRGLLTADRLAQFRQDSVFVNIGRGTVLADEADLISVLDTGPLRAAVLDVTNPEPPDPSSPLYTHPNVFLTPHLSGATQVRSAARLIAANVGRLRSGDDPFPLLDRSRGY